MRNTDWNLYYKEKRRKNPTFFQKTTIFKIIGLIKKFGTQNDLKVSELGGADSIIYSHFVDAIPTSQYLIIDNNLFGLDLTQRRSGSPRPKCELVDLVSTRLERDDDVVFSIGLIEHFDKETTKRVIENHISAVRPGGIVLVTFPTPTFLYKLVRYTAELLGIWKFHDERPLDFTEVERVFCSNKFEILHKSINWWVLLTQGYVLARRI